MDKSISGEEPFVSIITVAYNSQKYIIDTINSVLSQSYNKFEYILLDDCSTDNTWEIIKRFNDYRIKAIRNTYNLGEYSNRNKALSIAKGEYVLFIDADDVLFSEGLSNYIRYSIKFPEAGLFVQRSYYNNLLLPALIYPLDIYTNFFWGRYNLLSSSLASNFFKLRILHEFDFFDTNYISGDESLRLQIASKYPVAFIPGWSAWPRETPGQATSKITPILSTVEQLQMLNKIFNSEKCILPADFKSKCMKHLYKKIIILLVKSFFKINLKDVFFILKSISLERSIIINFFTRSELQSDFLEYYTPVNPYKKDFLR